jgi:tetratricopeptide (TPR) repeat protein
VKTLFNRARAYQELGKDAEAVRDFEHVTRIDPENDMAYLGLGVHYMNLKNYDKAGVYFQNAIDANHHNAKAYYLKGRVSHQRGLFSDALKNYNRALVIDDQLGEAYLYRGLVRIQLKTGHDPCLDFRKAQSLEVKDAMDAMARYCR